MTDQVKDRDLEKIQHEEYMRLRTLKHVAMGIDGYEATEPVALGLAYIAAALTATPAAPVAGPVALALLTYCQFRQTADLITKPIVALYVHQTYGNDTAALIGGLETLVEFVPIAKNIVDLIPTTTIAHNLYLDRLKREGKEVPDDLYIFKRAWDVLGPVLNRQPDRAARENQQPQRGPHPGDRTDPGYGRAGYGAAQAAAPI